MADAVDADVDAVVAVAGSMHAGLDALGLEHAHGTGFEDACPMSVGDVVAAAIVDDDGIDSCVVQGVGEQQPGRTCSDDRDVGLKFWHLGLLALFVLSVCARSLTQGEAVINE